MGDADFKIIHVYDTTDKPVVFAIATDAASLAERDNSDIGAMSVAVYFDEGMNINVLDDTGNWIKLG